MKKILYFAAFLYMLFSCSKENNDLNAINDHFYVRTDNANLPVQIEGNLNSGIIVLILHGGPGGNAQIYNDATKTFSDSLEKHFAVVYYDQRSSGVSSGKYKKREHLTINQHVIDLKDIITALNYRYGEKRIFLMGHSWGGTLGTAFLLTPGYNQMVEGWIEVDGAHNFDATEYVQETFIRIGNEMISNGKSVDFWQEVVDFSTTMDPSSDLDISKLNAYGFDAENYLNADGFLTGEDISADYLKMQYFSKYNAVTASTNLFFTSSGFGMFQEVSGTNFTDRLHEISLPCLFLWGKYDFVVPMTLGVEAYEKVSTPEKDKRLVIFNTSGHSPMINQPTAFTEQVIKWINER